VLLLDASGAVDDNGFAQLKLLAGRLAAPLSTQKTRLAVVFYNGAPCTMQPTGYCTPTCTPSDDHPCPDGTYVVSDFTDSASTAVVKLAAFKRPAGWRRDTVGALSKAQWLLMTQGRPDPGVRQTVFVVMAGAPTSVTAMNTKTENVKNSGIRLVFATVGYRTNQADNAEEWASYAPRVSASDQHANVIVKPTPGALTNDYVNVFYNLCPVTAEVASRPAPPPPPSQVGPVTEEADKGTWEKVADSS